MSVLDERTYSFITSLPYDFSLLDGGDGAHRVGGTTGFSRAIECDNRDDDRRHQGHAGRALFHARPLQLPAYLGGFYVGAVLAGDSFCSYL
jgi:hypothetical protein